MQSPPVTSREITRDWLFAAVAGIIEESEDLDWEEDLALLGLDSMGVMRVALALDEAGVEIGFDALIAAPRLSDWWELIEARRG